MKRSALVGQQRARAAGPPRRGPGSRCRSRAPGRRSRRTRRPPPSPARSRRSRRPAGSRRRRSRRGRRPPSTPLRSRLLVPDQRGASPPTPSSSRRASASRSSQEPGELDAATSARRRSRDSRLPITGSRSRSPRSAGWRAASRRAPSSALGVVGLELDHPADPDVVDALEAERRQRPLDGLALGIEDPLLGPDQDARTRPLRSGRSRDPLVGLDVLGPGLLDDVVGQLGGRRGVVPAGGVGPVADVLLVERGLGRARARSCRPARSARSPGSAPRRRARSRRRRGCRTRTWCRRG